MIANGITFLHQESARVTSRRSCYSRNKERDAVKLAVVAASCFLMFGLAERGSAAPIPSRSSTTQAAASIPESTIAAAREVLTATLVDRGLTAAEATARLNELEDNEICALAERVDQLQAAGGLNRWQIGAIVVGGIVVMTLWLTFLGASL